MNRRGTCLTALALVALASRAQTARAQEAAQQLDRVEIVGSHLKRVDTETPTPISIYSRNEIAASGAARIGDFLLALPFAGAGGFDDRATALDFHLGAAALSLRGLGPGATLVLLNGRRIAAYGLALDNDDTFVDLNSLPLSAVERIEVLRDGASAIYGADAIGGVVNVVLRRDFAGAETNLRLGQAGRGDSTQRAASATIGAGTLSADRYNAFVTFDALRQDATPFTARAFSRSADQRPRGGRDWRSTFSFPPTVRVPGGAPMPGPGCPPGQIATPVGLRGSLCLFDFNPYIDLLPRVARDAVLAVGSFAPVSQVRLYAEAAATRTRTTSHNAPPPIRTVVPATAPTNPYGDDVIVNWRPVDAGARRNESVIGFRRGVAGAQGHWSGWDWDIGAGINTIRTDYRLVNQLRTSALLAALEAGTLNPFIASNDPAALAAVRVDAQDRYVGQSRFVQATASSDLRQLAHGPLALALGVERRREGFTTELDPLAIAGDLASTGGAGTADAAANRTVVAAFAELNWPAARGIELQLAARHDRYSDFGGSTSPKVAVRWQPAKTLLLRASAGRGFLAPSLQQLNRPRSAFIDDFEDPLRCPVTQSIDDCGFGKLHSQQGNANLKPERSRQHNIGVAIEPTARASVSVDVWRIEHRDKIVFGDRFFVANESSFPETVLRAAPTPEDLARGLPGAIVELRDTYVNLASRDVRGVDVEFKYRSAPRRWGSVGLSGVVSYLERFVERATPQAVASDKAGADGRPRLRAQLNLSWQREAWRAGAAVKFIGHSRYTPENADAERAMASWTVFDVHVGWSGPHDEVVAAVRNVADRAPPMRDSFFGYDPSLHDPMGRAWSVSWRHAF